MAKFSVEWLSQSFYTSTEQVDIEEGRQYGRHGITRSRMPCVVVPRPHVQKLFSFIRLGSSNIMYKISLKITNNAKKLTKKTQKWLEIGKMSTLFSDAILHSSGLS
jgi:hypothetical protein